MPKAERRFTELVTAVVSPATRARLESIPNISKFIRDAIEEKLERESTKEES